MSRASDFRALLASRPYLHTAGVYSAVEARIAEAVGLPFVYVSGYSCSLGHLGRADLGFVTMTEMVTWSRGIASAVNVPVIADADDGYGGILSITRTVEEFERAGLAGINVEDQRFPKRCGHLSGVECLPVQESVAKLEAALGARRDPDFVIIARTDLLGAAGGELEEAIERARRYAAAGADVVWAEFPAPDRSAAVSFSEALRAEFPDLPLFFNYSSSFDWAALSDPLSFEELAKLGYRVIVVGLGTIHAAMQAEWDFLCDLREHGHLAQVRLQRRLRGHPTHDHHAMGQLERFRSLEEQHRADADPGAEKPRAR